MPTFEIVTIEKWETVVEYTVQAPSLKAALELIETSRADYDDHDHTGEDEVIEVLETKEVAA